MQLILRQGGTIVLRFDRGDEVIGALQAFCQEQGIGAAALVGIGACSSVTLSFYRLAARSYEDRVVAEDQEICSLQGNVALRNGAPVIHAHGTFSDRRGNVHGGHIKHLVVSATCEVSLTVLEGAMRRSPNAEVGLNLLA